MSIMCQICGRIFEKIITNSHLKSHNLTTIEYKHKYGPDSMSSETYRNERSSKFLGENNPMFGREHSEQSKGKISKANSNKLAHNKGVPLSNETKIKLSEIGKQRHQKWKDDGIHPQIGKKLSEITKEKIRQARAKQVITAEQCQRAYQTRIQNGNKPPFLGRTFTDKTKQILSKKSKEFWTKNRKLYDDAILGAIHQCDLTLIGDLTNHSIQLRCNKCSTEFSRTRQMFVPSKIRHDICDVCYPKTVKHSKDELEILAYLRSIYDGTILFGNRSTIYPLELDIYIPDLSLAIEYCGLYWHSELQGKDKSYHANKLVKCQELNIRLITIFEDEYLYTKEIVLHRLKHIIGLSSKRIYARNCQIQEIPAELANRFLNENHIQGSGRSNYAYGLFLDNDLLAVMTFLNGDISKNHNSVELNRFATKLDYSIVGGASKLFHYFVRTHNPNRVITYADRRWSIGNLYTQMGFEFTHITPPNYWYISGTKRIHRFALRKKSDDDQNLTEWENRVQQGYNRIWDCGNLKYTWIQK